MQLTYKKSLSLAPYLRCVHIPCYGMEIETGHPEMTESVEYVKMGK